MQNDLNQETLDDIDAFDEGPSKTKRKQHMDELQKLGMELVELSRDKLSKIDLPDVLVDAIKLAQKITSNGAIRRQNQYIGKLMRAVDADYVRERLVELSADSVKSTRVLHKCENWRDRLLADDKELQIFASEFNVSDIGQLRSHIRSCRRERELGQVKSYRKLFKFIRDIIETEK